jgi:hypothetical protein
MPYWDSISRPSTVLSTPKAAMSTSMSATASWRFSVPRSRMATNAARALRAALAVLGAMPGISAGAGRSLETHVGVATGVVVASGTGSASHRAYTVTGETVNLASRLTDVAPPGSILISEAVRLELDKLLELEKHGSISAKGFDEPVCAWRVLAVKDRSAHRPLIGRRAEIAQFIASAEACLSDRRGRVICIRGEAGIGKSRLAQAFEDEAVSLGFACHASRVLDFGSRTGHDALRTLLRDLLAIDTGALEDKRTQLTRLVETGFLAKDSIVFLPDLLAIDPLPSERALQTAMDMAARTEGRREAIRQIVQHASDSCPRMLICEDIHWADDELLGDLASIGAAVNDCPALLVVTCRPETDKLDHE